MAVFDVIIPNMPNLKIRPSGPKKVWFFLTFPYEKTTFQWPKVVSEVIFPTNLGYICIVKWSSIFESESEEKATFTH